MTDDKNGKLVELFLKLMLKKKKAILSMSESLVNESFGFGELPSEKLMKMKVSAKDMLDSVKNKKVNESEEKIKVGSSVVVNYPTLKKPFTAKVKHILKSPTGLVYVLGGDRGVWDAKNVSLKESVNESKSMKLIH